jgi:hypothetical protein
MLYARHSQELHTASTPLARGKGGGKASRGKGEVDAAIGARRDDPPRRLLA